MAVVNSIWRIQNDPAEDYYAETEQKKISNYVLVGFMQLNVGRPCCSWVVGCRGAVIVLGSWDELGCGLWLSHDNGVL